MSSDTRTSQDYKSLLALCTKTKLEHKINLLRKEPQLLTITPTQLFPTLFDIVAHLKASGNIRNYPIEAKFSTLQKFKLICTSSNKNCPVYFRVEEVEEDGQFRLSEAWIEHNHDMLELEMDKGIKNVGNATIESSTLRGGIRVRVDDGRGSSSEGESGSEEEDNNSEGGTYEEIQDSQVLETTPIASTSRDIPRVKKAASGLTFRAHYNIRNDVQDLVTGSKQLPFPTSSNKISIKDHDNFRIYTSASAIQNNFAVQLNNSSFGTSPTKFRINCSRNSSKIRGSERCGFTMDIIVKEIIDGEKVWIVEGETEHNRVCLSSRGGSTSSSTGPTVASASRPNTPNSPPLPSKHVDKKLRLSSPPPPLTLSIPTTIKKPKRTIPTSNFTSITIEQLSSFLYNLSPILSINYSQLLYEKGNLNTLENLSNLISMSSVQLEEFLIDLEIREGEGCIKVVQRMAFKNKIAEMKKSLKKASR